MERIKAWAVTATVIFGLAGCTVEGPAPGDRDGDSSVGSGEPATPPALDPPEEEPGPGSIADHETGHPPPAEPPPADPSPADPPPAEPPSEEDANEVCYSGVDAPVCFPVVSFDAAFPAAYDYPFSSQAAYAAPLRFIDLEAVSASTLLAPNFALGELMQAHKGRYGILQPHVVDKLQTIRAQTGGAVIVHSAYRNPGYNAGVGGATFSRHMYGDGIDMHSAVVSLNTLRSRCQDLGADYVSVYATHVHCDWRYAALEPAFFGPETAPMIVGDIHERAGDEAAFIVADGTWFADADGFDEGEPYREWSAFDARGRRLETVAGDSYAPPAGAAVVEVVIGGRVTLRADAARPGEPSRRRAIGPLRLDTLSRPFEAHAH